MKNKITKLSFAFICFCALFFASCGNSAPKGALDGPEYTFAYICPMHCEGSGSAEMGTCPVCKMDYVVNEDKSKAAPAVKDPHEGHNHDAHEGHDHGSDEGHDH